MIRTFYSKVGIWYYVCILIAGSIMTYSLWYKHLCTALFFMLLTLVLTQMLINLSYVISDEELIINLGKPFKRRNIAINNILSIKKKRSLASAAALSLDKLEICYITKDSKNYISVSPKDKKDFTLYLKKKNSNIIVDI